MKKCHHDSTKYDNPFYIAMRGIAAEIRAYVVPPRKTPKFTVTIYGVNESHVTLVIKRKYGRPLNKKFQIKESDMIIKLIHQYQPDGDTECRLSVDLAAPDSIDRIVEWLIKRATEVRVC